MEWETAQAASDSESDRRTRNDSEGRWEPEALRPGLVAADGPGRLKGTDRSLTLPVSVRVGPRPSARAAIARLAARLLIVDWKMITERGV